MRLCRLLFFFIFISASQALAQQHTVVLKKDYNGDLISFLSLLQSEHDFPLIFSPSTIENQAFSIASGTYDEQRIFLILTNVGIEVSQNNTGYILTQKQTYTLSGYVRDDLSGESIIGMTVRLAGTTIGVVTNRYGFYSISIPKGIHVIQFDHISYTDVQDTINLDKDVTLDVKMRPRVSSLSEVIVTAKTHDYHVASRLPGHITLNYERKGEIPYFLGEVDVLQESLLYPGIRTLGEDGSGLNVRGGSIDQNLITVDEATIYNPYHFYGLISVFNPESIKSVNIMKGFVPASFGGRASSVINIQQNEGNNEEFHVSGGLGFVSGRLMVEGPIKKRESSFLFSARQSILNLSLATANNSPTASSSSFTDLNLKLNWKLNNRNTFYLSGYTGNDQNENTFNTVRNWGNNTGTLRWNTIWSPKWFSNLSASVSDYTYRVTDPVESGSHIGKSSILDVSMKHDNQIFLNPKATLEFGWQVTHHKLKPGERVPIDEFSSSTNPLYLDNEQGWELGAYVSLQQKVTPWLDAQIGLRYTGQSTYGGRTVYAYHSQLPKSPLTIIDTINYMKNEHITYYDGLEPRVLITGLINERNSIKLAFTRTFQYMHLLSAGATPAPTDIWKLSDTYIRPLRSDHLSIGYFSSLFDDKWLLSTDVYYKDFANLIDYKDGADLLFNPTPETEILQGIGYAYGVEVMIEKPVGKLRGWASYTYSVSKQSFTGRFPQETINNGDFYFTNHDKPHDVSIALIGYLKPRLTASGTFNYSTGRPITFPSGKYQYNNTTVPHFVNRNADRISNYHRLDLALKVKGKSHKKDGRVRKNQDYWTFSVYNVYARKNAYSYFFRQSMTDPDLTETVRYSIFGTAIPAVTYNFRF